MIKKLLEITDGILNRITMYRLVVYMLIFWVVLAAIFGFFGWMPYSFSGLAFSSAILIGASWLINRIFAKIWRVPANSESFLITALILVLIITPAGHGAYLSKIGFLIAAAALAMASKYIINIGGKHLFNPAAFAVAATALTLNQSASWWIGTPIILPFVLIGGLLVIRKLRQADLGIAFIAAAVIAMFSAATAPGSVANPWFIVWRGLIYSPMFFFATVMLTEPLTMPPNRDGRISYGILVGWMFAPQTHIGSYYFTPEVALLAGNIFSYIISPKGKHVLKLKEKQKVGEGVYDFIFEGKKPLKFKPGQYMEWTLGHKKTDSRGNRRYFTVASSPTEKDVILGMKFYPEPSSFKRGMLAMQPGNEIMAGQLAGDFVLPRNEKEKLAFIAGGIGITPYRSMLKYLVDCGEKRDIVLLYSNRKADEIVYQDVMEDAWRKLDVRVVCTLTDKESVPADWNGYTGYFDAQIISKEVPDFRERTFYISGSHVMVTAFEETLRSMGVARRKIKTDFFPGLA